MKKSFESSAMSIEFTFGGFASILKTHGSLLTALGVTMGSLLKSKLMVMISPESDMIVPVEGVNVPMILPKPSLTVMFVGAMR